MMMRIDTVSTLRKIIPVSSFAIAVVFLLGASVISVNDLITMRSTLSADQELLAKIKDRVAQSEGLAPLDPSVYLIDATTQSIAAGEMQRLVSVLFADAGADLQLKDIIPAEPDGDAGRLAIAINFEIEESRLPDLLDRVENSKPALLIERLSVRILTNSQTPDGRRLQGTATLVGAWREPS